MGYDRHRAIIVSSFDKELIIEAHKKAVGVFKEIVTGIVPAAINGYTSFMIGPDGSKLGWDEANRHTGFRKKFIEWMETKRYEDNSTSLKYVEVQYADDDKETEVICSSDEKEFLEEGEVISQQTNAEKAIEDIYWNDILDWCWKFFETEADYDIDKKMWDTSGSRSQQCAGDFLVECGLLEVVESIHNRSIYKKVK